MNNSIDESYRHELVQKFEESPFWRHMQFKIITLERGSAVIEMTVQNHLLNAIGILQGGVSAALLDAVLGLAVRTVEKRVTVTVNLNVSYIKPARHERRLRANGKLLSLGETIATSQAEVWDDTRLIAHGTGTFKIST